MDQIIWIVPLDDQAKKKFASSEYSATGYFGNESSDTTFYRQAALIIDLPEFYKRKSLKEIKEEISINFNEEGKEVVQEKNKQICLQKKKIDRLAKKRCFKSDAWKTELEENWCQRRFN